jgi:hypothetical protein
MEGRTEGDEMMGMGVNIIEGIQTRIQSNVEPERNLVVVMVVVIAMIWREGEAIGHKAGGSIGSDNGLASLISECYQKIENGEKFRDMEKRERFAGARFQAPREIEIEVDRPAM